MQNFDFHTITKIEFGKDTQSKTAELIREFGGNSVLVVYGGKSAEKSGLIGEITKNLADNGLNYTLFGGITINPQLEDVRQGVRLAVENGVDFVLGVGGGSAIDAAKAIAHGTANPEVDVWDIWTFKHTLTKSLPIGTVLTIAAAGSEMSKSSVISHRELQLKRGFTSPFNMPKFAIMNPELTYTLPKRHVACGVSDIMMHTLDRFYAPGFNMTTDEIAGAVLRTVMHCGKKLLDEPDNYDYASEVMWCSSLSHNSLTGLGRPIDLGVHGLSHAISAIFDSIHGEALTSMFGSFVRYVSKKGDERFIRLGELVFAKKMTAEEVAVAFEEYFKSIGMPISLVELLGVQSDEMLHKLAHNAVNQGARPLGAYYKLPEEEVYEIFKMSNEINMK